MESQVLRHSPDGAAHSMIVGSCIDEPLPGALVQRHGFAVRGWVATGDGEPPTAIRIVVDGRTIGETQLFYVRPDVNASLGIDPTIRTAFVATCLIPNTMRGNGRIRISSVAVEASGTERVIDTRELEFSAYDYRVSSHGYMFEDTFTQVIPRASVYASGPPAPDASGEVLEILTRYLDPGAKVLDVGCGIGAYGRAFRELGLSWTGCEIRPEYVEAARSNGLDAHLVVGEQLPFDDASFDAAFANEVLEHVHDPHPFLREIRRVAPSAAYFSVPNFEAIPVTAAFYAIPWHMLEPDHWNFYARGSLKSILSEYYENVEVFEYGELKLLRALDGLPVYNHLFAVARNARATSP